MRILWFLSGWICVGIGALGIITPLLPTVPLLLLAAMCFAKSSQKAHDWLLGHKTFGPLIIDWQEKGAIPKNAKITATGFIILAFTISIIMELSWLLLGIQALVLSCVLIFIWSRPGSRRK